MVERLTQWSDQIAGLESKARAAGPRLATSVALRLKALRQRHEDYAGQLSTAQEASEVEFRHMQRGMERMVHGFRRAYLETLCQFPR
jgi:hypothetical protein